MGGGSAHGGGVPTGKVPTGDVYPRGYMPTAGGGVSAHGRGGYTHGGGGKPPQGCRLCARTSPSPASPRLSPFPPVTSGGFPAPSLSHSPPTSLGTHWRKEEPHSRFLVFFGGFLLWSKNCFRALPDHRQPNNAPAPTHGAAGSLHTATPAPGFAARSRSATVPCCARLIRNVLYRAGALSQMERDPTGMSQPVSPSAGCSSALPYTSPGRYSPDGADAAGVDAAGSSSPGEREPGMRPQSSARAPAAALQHHSENKLRKKKKSFLGGPARREGVCRGGRTVAVRPRRVPVRPLPQSGPRPAPHPGGGGIPAAPMGLRHRGARPRQRCLHRAGACRHRGLRAAAMEEAGCALPPCSRCDAASLCPRVPAHRSLLQPHAPVHQRVCQRCAPRCSHLSPAVCPRSLSLCPVPRGALSAGPRAASVCPGVRRSVRVVPGCGAAAVPEGPHGLCRVPRPLTLLTRLSSRHNE